MRVTEFKDVEKLNPLTHAVLGTLYVPELSIYEVEEYTATLAAHCFKLAENTFAESKEMDEVEPLSAGFVFNGDKVAVWRGKKAPTNLYEEKLLNKAALVFTQISLTMFLCNDEAECICPFDEPFGTMKRSRLKLFGDFIKDSEATGQFNKLLLGIKEEATVPNVEKGVSKRKK